MTLAMYPIGTDAKTINYPLMKQILSIPEHLVPILQSARKSAGLSQGVLSKRMGLSQSRMSAIVARAANASPIHPAVVRVRDDKVGKWPDVRNNQITNWFVATAQDATASQAPSTVLRRVRYASSWSGRQTSSIPHPCVWSNCCPFVPSCNWSSWCKPKALLSNSLMGQLRRNGDEYWQLSRCPQARAIAA